VKAFVITIVDNKHSTSLANRCIESCGKHGLDVEIFPATTPRSDNFQELIEESGLDPNNFDNEWSRQDNAIACFLSHSRLWKHCVEINEDVLILEHDALMTSRLPPTLKVDKCCTLGKPSYGKYDAPITLGVGPLKQKPYFGGAHSYVVTPRGAKELLEEIPNKSKIPDIYMNLEDFPWLQEYYPWLFIVKDSFSMTQKERGCVAKHNYDNGFKILDA
jgi:hypothetical protein